MSHVRAITDRCCNPLTSCRSAAIHSFVLPSDPDSITTVQTKELSYPLLNFISLPGHPGHLLLSLDTAWGILKKNQVEDAAIKGATASEEQIEAMSRSHLVVQVASDGSVSLIPSRILSHFVIISLTM